MFITGDGLYSVYVDIEDIPETDICLKDDIREQLMMETEGS